MKKSQTLVEVLVALWILSMAFFAGYGLIVSGLKSFSMTSKRIQATGYLQAGFEEIRNIRDSNLDAGRTFDQDIPIGNVKVSEKNGGGFKIDSNVPSDDLENGFFREISISKTSDTITITATVKWGNSGSKITGKSVLTNWRMP